MGIVGWAILGVVLGAVGSEILHSRKPNLVEKVEDTAKRLVDSMRSSKPPSEPADEEVGGEAEPQADEGEPAVDGAEST